MQATGNNQLPSTQQSIRVTADGLSFYAGPEAIVVCGPSTRVPMSEFRREEAATLLDSVCPSTAPRAVLHNVLPSLEVVEIFSIDNQLLQQLHNQYPSHRILSVNAMVLETLWRYDNSMGSATRRLYAYCHDGEMLVVSYNQLGLYWANTFAVDDTVEALFFMLSSWRSLGMDAEKDECLVIDTEELVNGLKPYLRHVSVLTPADVLGQERAKGDVPFDIMVI